MSGYGTLQVIFGDWPWYMLAGSMVIAICSVAAVVLFGRWLVSWLCEQPRRKGGSNGG